MIGTLADASGAALRARADALQRAAFVDHDGLDDDVAVLEFLHFSKKEASVRLETLLRSAIANWEAKNPGTTEGFRSASRPESSSWVFSSSRVPSS